MDVQRFELLTVGSGEAALEQMVQAGCGVTGFDVSIRQLELRRFSRGCTGLADFDAAVLGIRATGLGYLGAARGSRE